MLSAAQQLRLQRVVEVSAGADSLVHHEAAEGGAVAAAGRGLLRDVHGRGDQVRMHGRRWVRLPSVCC